MTKSTPTTSVREHDNMHTAIHEEAMNWAKAGYPVIPLRPHDDAHSAAGKAPLLKSWQNIDADAEQMAQWLRKWPYMNLGLVLGSPSGLVGLDIDGPGGEALLKEKSRGDLPQTWEYTTPGGRRLLYSLPDGFQSKTRTFSVKGKKHEELKIQASGSQTVIPPSIGPNREVYTWLTGQSPDDMDEATMAPQWILDAIASELHSEEPSLQLLASKCQAFKDRLEEQRRGGINEHDWFLWISLLTAAGKPEAARAFSLLSSKHDKRSEDRLNEEEEASSSAMVRCTTFGCTEQQILECHGTLRKNDGGQTANSPGAFLRSTSVEDTTFDWPTDPIYELYIECLRGTDYQIDADGILLFTGGKQAIKVANFVARAVTQINRNDGTQTDGWYVLEGIAQGGRPLEQIMVSRKDFLQMSWVARWGIEAVIFQGRHQHLRTATQLASQGAPSEELYTHLGWVRAQNKWAYLYAGGAIGSNDISMEIDKALRKYRFPEITAPAEKAAKASLQLLDIAPDRVMVPLLATAYLAPLCEPLRRAGLEPNFCTWLHGRTGTRKTSLSLVLLNHFGAFGRTNPPASFKDTPNALEMKASLAKDTLLVVDDFHPASTGGENAILAQTAQKLLRMFGDRIGRERMTSTADGFRPQHTPKGIALITGEDLTSGHSSVARLFAVELLPEDVNLDRLTEAQNNGDLIAQAMRGYIEFLRPQMDDLPELLKDRFSELRDAFSCASHGRLTEAAAWLLLAYELMLEYMAEVGAIPEDLQNSLFGNAWTTLTELVNLQSKEILSETPGEKFIKALTEMIGSGAISSIQNSGKKVLCYRQEKLGWEHRGNYYFLPQALYGAVTGWMHQKGTSLYVTDKVLWRQLEAMGAIQVEKGDRKNRTIKRALPWASGQRQRVLSILQSVLNAVDED